MEVDDRGAAPSAGDPCSRLAQDQRPQEAQSVVSYALALPSKARFRAHVTVRAGGGSKVAGRVSVHFSSRGGEERILFDEPAEDLTGGRGIDIDLSEFGEDFARLSFIHAIEASDSEVGATLYWEEAKITGTRRTHIVENLSEVLKKLKNKRL